MAKFCIVMTTTENKEQAGEIISVVLNKKLAACIQTRDIESHYIWQGKICHDNEVLIWFKTESDLYSDLERTIKEIHPYEVPEIISVPIDSISVEYSAWLKSVII